MKFAYVDESGMGDEPYLVTAAVVADGQRMRLTKESWSALFERLSELAGREVSELKSSDLYRGNRLWHGVEGRARHHAMAEILEWLRDRHHKVVFSGVDKEAYETARIGSVELQSLRDPWCLSMTHLLLHLQRAHARLPRPKGNTVVICDDQARHKTHWLQVVRDPPGWTDAYYGRTNRQTPLDQVVDVPYFADSEHVLLIQAADLIAFVLRRVAEIAGGRPERYDGEAETLTGWTTIISEMTSGQPRMWPAQGGTSAHQVFATVAPPGLQAI